jgi:hypothetical protein
VRRASFGAHGGSRFHFGKRNYKQTQLHPRVANTNLDRNCQCQLLGVLCAEVSDVRLDSGLGERRGFQNALRIQRPPDFEYGPRSADGMPGSIHPLVGGGGSFLPVPEVAAQIHGKEPN